MIRVAIADDQPLFCSGIQMLVNSQDDMEFAGSAPDGQAAVELAAAAKPDVFLMDIRMPVKNGIEATRDILTSPVGGKPAVIVLTTFERDVAVLEAVHAGASGFLMKDTTPEFLLAAIRTVHSGQSVIAPRNTIGVIRGLTDAKPQRAPEEFLADLSAREREIYLYAARGLSNGEIADTTFIAETTVKSHMSSILSKLDLNSRVQLVAHAWEHGLVR